MSNAHVLCQVGVLPASRCRTISSVQHKTDSRGGTEDLVTSANIESFLKPDSQYVLSIDLGTSGCKCAVVSLHGEVVAWHFAAVDTQFIGHNGAEQRPDDWWTAFLTSSRHVTEIAKRKGLQIVAVCASTQGEGTVAVDETGVALHPAILWLDMRGADLIQKRAGHGYLRFSGYNIRSLTRWIRLTGGAPALSGKDPAAHMAFIQHELPDVYRKTHKFLNVLDYLNFRLTGRMVATGDSILTSWVTDNRDPTRIQYDAHLIRILGVDAEKLPEIVHSTDIIGSLAESVASQIGLSSDTPVVAGSIDTSAAAVGSGAVADGKVHLYIGTSSWFGVHLPDKRTSLTSQIASVPCALPDRYLAIALQSAAGANLSFLRDQVILNQDELLQDEEQPDVYRLLDEIAARVPAGARGILYTPWLFGERTPVDDPNIRASLLNVSMEHNREDIIRAILEGVALNTRWMFESLQKFLGQQSTDEIAIVGGGGASDVWCQIFADVMNIRVRQIQSSLQANVLGSAFIAGVGIGAMRFEDVPKRCHTKHVYEPNRDHRTVYDHSYDSFRDAYRRLAPFYRNLNKGRGTGRPSS